MELAARGEDVLIGVIRSGVCIFGGVLFLNHKVGIYAEKSGVLVDGTQILSTLDSPDPTEGLVVDTGVGILASLSELQVTNAYLADQAVGIWLFGSHDAISWNTFNCLTFNSQTSQLPADHFGPGDPPAAVPSSGDVLPGNWCGCGPVDKNPCYFQ